MAITQATIAQLQAMRITLGQQVDAQTRDMTTAWGNAWAELVTEWQKAVDDLLEAAEHGWPTRTKVLRAERVSRALKATLEAVQDLTRKDGVRITANLPSMLQQVDYWQQIVSASQLPNSYDLQWTRVDRRQLEKIVSRTAGRIVSLNRPIPKWVDQQIKAVLVRGVAIGDNPETAARQIMARTQGRFDGGLTRAKTIARTEMLDAHRAAATAARTENADVISGWIWQCDLSVRTCPACLSMDGSRHPASDPGPDGHQNCRCVGIPTPLSWRELGIDLDEPADTRLSAHDWYDQQPTSVQQQILGKARWQQLNSGQLSWDDMAVRRHNPGWRDSVQVRPLQTR